MIFARFEISSHRRQRGSLNAILGLAKADKESIAGHSDDIDKAKDILLKMAQKDDRVLKEDNPPVVMVEALGDSSVNLKLRTWVKSEDYWGLFFDITENVKKQFDAAGISIPFPQQDVHLYNHK